MLSWSANLHLANILMALYQVWDSAVLIEKIDIKNAPFSMMTIDVLVGIQEKNPLRLEYDRAHLAVYVKCEERYVYLGNLVQLPKINGFDSCDMKNLLMVLRAAEKVFSEQIHKRRE